MIDWNSIGKKLGYKSAVEAVAHLYYVKGLSIDQVCAKMVVSRGALYDFMDKHALPRRDRMWTRVTGGPACPHCGHTKSIVKWGSVFPDHPGYHRYRRCKKCENYFATIEEAIKNG